MAMNKQRKTSNVLNILNYDDAGNIVIKDYGQVVRYSWNGLIHGFVGPVSVSSVSAATTDTDRFLVSDGGVLKYRTGVEVLSDIGGVPSTRTLTINGTAFDLSVDRSWTIPSANIYNSDGTLTGNRTLTTAGNTLAFRTGGVDEFLFTPNNGSTFPILKVYNVTYGGKLDLGYGYFQVGGGALSLGNTNNGNINIFAGTQKAQLFGATGNLVLQNGGTFSDGGQRLQVYGSVKFDAGTDTNGFYWDNTNKRLGIGTNTPTESLHVPGQIRFGNTTNGFFISSNSITAYGNIFWGIQSDRSFQITDNSFTSTYLRINRATGNTSLGSSADGGQRLQVYGDAFIKGSGNTSATNALSIQDSAGNDMLRVRNDGTIRIGTQTILLSASQDGNATSLVGRGLLLQTGVGTMANAGEFTITGNFSATSLNSWTFKSVTSFIPLSGTATYSGLWLQPTINQQGGANGITRGLYVNPTLTAAADWRSIEWSNNSGWGLYGAGTADNYLGGRLTIGDTTIGSNIVNVRTNLIGSFASSIRVGSLATNSNTTLSAGFMSQLGTDAVTFNFPSIIHFYARQGTIGAGSTITSQIGFLAEDNFTGAINNYGFLGNVLSGTNRWNLYMAGTADNYLRGKLLINTTSVGTFALDVNGTGRFTGNVEIDRVRIQTNGKFWYNNIWGERWAMNIAGDSDMSFTCTKGTQSIIFRGESTFTHIIASNNVSSSLFIGKFEGREGYIVATQNTNTGDYSASIGRVAAGYTPGTISPGATNTNGVPLYLHPGNGGGSGLRSDIIFQTVDDATYAANGTHQLTNRLYVKGSTGNILINTSTDAGYKLQVTSTVSDNHLLVWGTSAPSIRIDNAATGATQRFVFGLATATNNFITGAVAGDICMTTQSSSPLLFGANATEVMRITASSNLLINKTADGGQKLQVSGTVNFASLPTSSAGLSAGDIWNNGGVLNIV